ncbi:InlB B-repeat-containing protein [Acholeplasma granularum]|uniref:InlB B-repeat-containing protein n=1 Tax=Acholeplasma granularum TaxID=264635 RepID=UPI00047050F4|nr:InlB B-repeat-containing protein [Acholeplasma granularum]
MKRIIHSFLIVFLLIIMSACEDTQMNGKYTVKFNTNGGNKINNIYILKGEFLDLPDDPIKKGYIFVYWYEDLESVKYENNLPITKNITLNALWEKEADANETTQIKAKINEDIIHIEKNLLVKNNQLNIVDKGPINNSDITWINNHPFISSSGTVLNLIPEFSMDSNATIKARFRLDGVIVDHTFNIELNDFEEVTISNFKNIPFYNQTDEYQVRDSNINLYYAEKGYVPYVKVIDFMNLLEGFIDSNIDINYLKDEHTLYMSYNYYDSSNGVNYELGLEIDSLYNKIKPTDSSFFWGYVKNTTTNYSRHINDDKNNPLAYLSEGKELLYDLNKYNLDIVSYEGDILLPYYIANQLFAGSSYYNVYYNVDALYGIYALPSEDSQAYEIIKTSSKNNNKIPSDLIVHNFNSLAFFMDHFYGLKDIKEIHSFYTYLLEDTDNLLSNNPLKQELGIFRLIVDKIDEPHTSYGYPGYYNDLNYYGPTINDINDFGPRLKSWYIDGLYQTDMAIANKWNITPSYNWSASDPKRQKYFFLDNLKTSVVLSLDAFATADIIEDSFWKDDIIKDVLKTQDQLFPNLENGSKYFYYNMSNKNENILEILIKDVSESTYINYQESLKSNGFETKLNTLSKVRETSTHIYYINSSYDKDFGAVSISMSVKELPNNSEPVFINDPLGLINLDSAVFMEFYMEKIIKLSANLKNIILDVTWNTGGNAGALYRVVGFITNESFSLSSISADTLVYQTDYIYIDGTPNYSNLNWGLLTSKTSFSAANSLATIFLENNLGPIIGIQSGGGASSITPILLPIGTAFTMSSNYVTAYRIGSNTLIDPYVYHHNEFGIEPTNPLDISKLYDNRSLLNIMNEYYK